MQKTNWNSIDSYVVVNLEKMKKCEIAHSLGTTPDNLSHRLRRLGKAERRQKIDPLLYEEYFKKNVNHKTWACMATELGVSVRTIARCLSTLGLSTKFS